MGCHFLLQCMKVKSESGVTQLCLTLSDPMDCSLPGSSVHRIFQARVLEWVAIAHYHHINTTYDCFMCYQLFNLFFSAQVSKLQNAELIQQGYVELHLTTENISLTLNQMSP